MRRRLPLRALLFALVVAACATATPPVETANAPVETAVPVEPEPLGAATSPCGRYTLRLDVASWDVAPNRRPRLALQMAFRSAEPVHAARAPAVFPCRPARVTNVVPPDGAEFREDDLDGFGGLGGVESRWGGTIRFSGLELYRPSDRLRRLRVECRLLRVFSWTEHTILIAGPGSIAGPGATSEVLCPPFHVGLDGRETSALVSAWCGDDLRTLPAPQRELAAVLGHDWVAMSLELRDAAGRALRCTSGGGTGGTTVGGYEPEPVEPTGPAPAVAYPVTGTLRLPERWVVEIVPFEFEDLPLERAAGAPPSASTGRAAGAPGLHLSVIAPDAEPRRH